MSQCTLGSSSDQDGRPLRPVKVHQIDGLKGHSIQLLFYQIPHPACGSYLNLICNHPYHLADNFAPDEGDGWNGLSILWMISQGKIKLFHRERIMHHGQWAGNQLMHISNCRKLRLLGWSNHAQMEKYAVIIHVELWARLKSKKCNKTRIKPQIRNVQACGEAKYP